MFCLIFIKQFTFKLLSRLLAVGNYVSIKYIVFSFSFIHIPIGSDCSISILTGVNCLKKNMFIMHFLVKYKILETFPTD